MEINYKEILQNLMHELANINLILKSSAESISRESNRSNRKFDYDSIREQAEIILENSFLISLQLDIVNYHLNPSYAIEVETFEKRSLYGKFYKSIIAFKKRADQNGVKINVVGEVKTNIDSKPIIDTLPILILDNAVKYSPRGGTIEIEFEEDSRGIEVSISNLGPYVDIDERDSILKRGYRGREAVRSKVPGQGYGLDFVKFICEIHRAKLEVECEDDYSYIGDIKYAEYKLRLIFPKYIK